MQCPSFRGTEIRPANNIPVIFIKIKTNIFEIFNSNFVKIFRTKSGRFKETYLGHFTTEYLYL